MKIHEHSDLGLQVLAEQEALQQKLSYVGVNTFLGSVSPVCRTQNLLFKSAVLPLQSLTFLTSYFRSICNCSPSFTRPIDLPQSQTSWLWMLSFKPLRGPNSHPVPPLVPWSLWRWRAGGLWFEG